MLYHLAEPVVESTYIEILNNFRMMQITLNYIYLFKYVLRIVLHFLLLTVHG